MTRSITLDLSEADLAHIWANATWDGKDPKPLDAILLGILRDYAGKHRYLIKSIAVETQQDFHELDELTLTRFREAHPQPPGDGSPVKDVNIMPVHELCAEIRESTPHDRAAQRLQAVALELVNWIEGTDGPAQ